MTDEPGATWLGELPLWTQDAICTGRAKLQVLARALGLGEVVAARLAAVTSEVARRMNCDERLSLAIALERLSRGPRLRLEFRARGSAFELALLERFFDQVSAGRDRVLCSIDCPVSMPHDEAMLQRLRDQLQEKSRVELMLDLELQNRALAEHRAALEQTVQRRTRELREAMDSAEHASRAKSEFLSHMSHELRTPLNGVLGHSQILLRDGEATPRQRKSLAAIDSSGRHLLTLINDILDLSKIEAGEIAIEDAACDLPALTLDVCNIVQPRADKKGVEVRRLIGPEVPRCVRTDATKLRQCLVNIAGNAAKFTERGYIELRVRVEGDRLVFEVQDTGVGMTPSEIDELFQPFKQAKAGRAAGGTGLGLAISERLIKKLGGELRVTSEPQRGTTFRIELPCIVAAGTSAIAESSMSPLDVGELRLSEGQHCDVLVVDDNETNREVLVGLLEPIGFSVFQAQDGRQALDLLRAQPFDLVLMDLRMPRMSGEEALAEIRRDPLLAHTKVMAVTASMEARLMAQLEALGFDAVLGKPFLAGALLQKVHALTGVSWERTASSLADAALAASSPRSERRVPLDAAQAQQLLPDFQRALLVGDLQCMASQAAQLDVRDPAFKAWADRVQELCDAFDLQGLEALGRELEERAH